MEKSYNRIQDCKTERNIEQEFSDSNMDVIALCSVLCAQYVYRVVWSSTLQ